MNCCFHKNVRFNETIQYYGGINMDWKFWVGDVGIPVITFVIGLFTGKTIEKRITNKAKIKGTGNTVIQGSKIEK